MLSNDILVESSTLNKLLMEKLYKRVIELLSSGEFDDVFKNFLLGINDIPQHNGDTFSFINSGFTLISDKNLFTGAVFEIATYSVEHGEMTPFTGTLPGEIIPSDRRTDVQLKLGKQAIESLTVPGQINVLTQSYWDKYSMPPFDVTFVFDTITERLIFVAVQCEKTLLSDVGTFGNTDQRSIRSGPRRRESGDRRPPGRHG